MSEVSLIAFQYAKADCVTKLTEQIKSLMATSRAESGCISYNVYRDTSAPETFIFHETWASQADIDQHFNSASFQAFWSHRMDYLTKDVEIHFVEPFS
jgi:quinol monooxygenase YgiN